MNFVFYFNLFYLVCFVLFCLFCFILRYQVTDSQISYDRTFVNHRSSQMWDSLSVWRWILLESHSKLSYSHFRMVVFFIYFLTLTSIKCFRSFLYVNSRYQNLLRRPTCICMLFANIFCMRDSFHHGRLSLSYPIFF